MLEIAQDRAYSTTFYEDKKPQKCDIDHIFVINQKAVKPFIYLN